MGAREHSLTLVAMSGREEVGSAQTKPPPSPVPTRYSALVGREGELSASAYLILSGDFSLPAYSEEGGGLSVNVYFTPFRYLPLLPLGEIAAASVWGRGGRRVSSLPPRGQREGLGVPSQEGARRAPRGTLYRKVTKVVSLQSPVYLAVQ